MMIKKYKKLVSTNSEAKEMALRGAEPWTVVLSGEQSSGYGRKGDGWFSPEGGLYFSIILPKGDIDDLQTITILAAFVVGKAIKEKFRLEPLIKLPNDVLIGRRKVCGILTENVIGGEVKASVIGIGLNTNIDEFPPELKDTATSLKNETQKEINNEEILKEITMELQRQFKIISQ
jgi:BirA family biotin operon repressor/biotin-[acetyl-CoA-carboxylase] ligase